jgi:HSP20 family protein
MAEKSAAGTQAAPSRPLVTSTKTESLTQRIEGLYNQIAQRAYDIFESHGRTHGHDVEHWLTAENQVLQPVRLQVEDKGSELIVHANVPGFASDDLEIQVEPQRLILSGTRQSKKETKKDDTTVTEVSADQIYQEIVLPAEVETSRVTATLKNGILDVILPKMSTPKSIAVDSKAS